MANLRRGERVLDLNGNQFTLRLSYNEVSEAERSMGVSMIDLLTDILDRKRNVAFHELRALFYHGVRGQHGVTTMDEAGDYIGEVFHHEGQAALTVLANTIFEALGDLFPSDASKKKVDGTGTT